VLSYFDVKPFIIRESAFYLLQSTGRKKNILIIGSGGREHALGWKLARSRMVKKVFYCPGNGGTKNNVAIDHLNYDKLIDSAAENDCETLVGPEEPLADGIVDQFLKRGLRIFGPTGAAAKLESSKVFSKQFMRRLDIKTPSFAVFTSYRDAEDYVRGQTHELVIKTEGLAAGKGVFVCRTQKQAIQALQVLMFDRKFEDSGNRVIAERKIQGKEASYIAICDGDSFVPLAISRDHKRACDGDAGPNTGGMGAYSPVENISENLEARIVNHIIKPTIRGMRELGSPFSGFLYAGLMLDSENGTPSVLEFNARMGDPECQSLMVRMGSDLYPYLDAAMDKRLHLMPPIKWKKQHSVCVVMASKGYPVKYTTGHRIYGLHSRVSNKVVIFHSGTSRKLTRHITTAGGRVLSVTATGHNLSAARREAYTAVRTIKWGDGGEHYRTDIGKPTIAQIN
jgi:phosphoribosylamine---glycine ligase